MSIKTKLFIAMFTVGALAAGPAGVLYFIQTRDMLYDQAGKAREQDIRRMAVVVADNLESEDRVPIMNYIRKAKAADPSLARITLEDRNGIIVADTESGMIGIREAPVAAPAAGPYAWDVEVKSTVKKEPLGRVRAEYKKEMIEAGIKADLGRVTARIIWIAVMGLSMGLLAGLLLAASIAKPLVRLAREARKVDAGNLEIGIEARGSDEVAVVTRSVKDMVGKLKALDELKDDFVNNVSHDLRSPLYTMSQYIDLLNSGRHGKLDGKQAEFLAHVKGSADRLSGFVNNVLDAAKIKSGAYGLDTAQANLHDIAREVMDFNREVFAREGITAELEGERDASGLECDAGAARRVLSNLIANAVKFTPEGGRITVSIKRGVGSITCAVSDTGAGIAGEDLERIFLRFAQAGKSGTGTGLGLSICRDLVAMHGGTIRAESEPGKGSTFIFTLPINKEGST